MVLAILLFGLVSVGLGWDGHQKWIWRGLILYSLPLVLQFQRFELIRIYALWFGVFLVLQTLVSPIVLNKSYITLEPHLNKSVNVPSNRLTGIDGKQHITTDAMGFRVTSNINYDHKPPGHFRIFAIGASSTEDIYVDDFKTWTHLLQEKLSTQLKPTITEVIDTGVSGLRAKHHLATFEHVISYKPDMVIFLFGINDWNYHIRKEFEPGKLTFYKLRNAIRFDYSLLASAVTAYKLANNKTKEDNAGSNGEEIANKMGSLRRPLKYKFRPRQVLEQYQHYLGKIGQACKRAAIPCVFVTEPTAYKGDADDQIKSHLWMTPPDEKYTLDFESLIDLAALYNEYMKSFARENGFAVFDLASKMEPSLLYFFDDCHFNIKGSQKVAELLSEYFSTRLQRGSSKEVEFVNTSG